MLCNFQASVLITLHYIHVPEATVEKKIKDFQGLIYGQKSIESHLILSVLRSCSNDGVRSGVLAPGFVMIVSCGSHRPQFQESQDLHTQRPNNPTNS